MMDEEKAGLIGGGSGDNGKKSQSPLDKLPFDKHYLVWGCYGCCGCCSCTCCCLLFVIMWIIPGLLGILMEKWWCEFTSCWNPFNQAPCQACKDQFTVNFPLTPVGINSMPFGYFALPLGLIPNYTVYNQFVERPWDDVWTLGAQMPEATANGTWWRGNELGFVMNNPYFWSHDAIFPQSIALGISVKQHAAIRPGLEKAFGQTSPYKDFVRSEIRRFFEHRREAGELSVPNDLQVLTHQVLHYVAFHGEAPDMTWDEATEFVNLQTRVVNVGTISQILPPQLYAVEHFGLLRNEVKDYIDRYTAILNKASWSEDVKTEDCSPSENCTVQLASGIFDALYAAGGLSVPGGIATALGVLYSESESNPAPGFVVPAGQELQFFWESIRFYAPVYGFPYWPVRPTCEGLTAEETANLSAEPCPKGHEKNWLNMHPVNQWQGGVRHVLFLGRAQRDSKKWGDDSHNFTLRNLSEYETKSVGFAEMAVDENVLGGRNDRDCPGKDLALLIGQLFFEEFDRSAWRADEAADIELDSRGPITQVTSFTLRPV